jgi:hypothetical protein
MQSRHGEAEELGQMRVLQQKLTARHAFRRVFEATLRDGFADELPPVRSGEFVQPIPQAPADVIRVEEDEHNVRPNQVPELLHVRDIVTRPPAAHAGIEKLKDARPEFRVRQFLQVMNVGVLLVEEPAERKGIPQHQDAEAITLDGGVAQMRRKEVIMDDPRAELVPRRAAGLVHSQSRGRVDGPETVQRLGRRQANQHLAQNQGQAAAEGEQQQPLRHTPDSPPA